MIKVMLVDDEVSVINGLKAYIDGMKCGFEVICDAKNGEEGLEKAIEYKPQIVITDITMPIMDGFEMVEKIKEYITNIKVVFLTCHENFNYAKKAVNLNVVEYLVKDAMTRDELRLVLGKIEKQILEESLRNEYNRNVSIEINQNRYQIGQVLINDILNVSSIDLENLKKRLLLYSYNLSRKKFVLLLLRIDKFDELIKHNVFNDLNLLKFAVLNIIDEVLKSNDIGEVFFRGENEFVIICNFNPNFKESIYEKIKLISRDIQKYMKRVIRSSCTLYIGKQFDSIYGIPDTYYRLSRLIDKRFYMPGEEIVLFEMEDLEYPAVDVGINSDFIKEFERLLIELDIEGLEFLIENYCTFVYRQKMPSRNVKNTIERALAAIINRLEINECKYELTLPADCSDIVKYNDSLTDLKDKLVLHTKKSVEILNVSRAFSVKTKIKKAIKYVNAHFHEEISLDIIASYLNMNSTYFSRYFKNQTGENFVDFVARLRINKAKELLRDTDLTIDEIAYKVGHVNKVYFSKVFKKIIGLNPGEYRQKERKAFNEIEIDCFL